MTRPGVTVQNPSGALEGPRFVAVCSWPECGWRSKAQVVKAAAEDEARWHRGIHRTVTP